MRSDQAAWNSSGLHCHLGSPLFRSSRTTKPTRSCCRSRRRWCEARPRACASTAPAAASRRNTCARSQRRPSNAYAEEIVSSFKRRCAEHRLPLPHLFVEPGRSLVARAGVALYTVGARKEIEGLRTWVSVDGGMADNIRPAMYDARVRGGRREPRRRRRRRDRDDRRQVLRVGRHPGEGRAAAADAAGRRHRAARLGRVLPDDGQQLQHVAEARGRRRAGRRRAPRAPPRDLRGPAGDGRRGGSEHR